MGKRRKRPGKPAIDSRIGELQVAKLEKELEKTDAETIKIRHENEKLLRELKQLNQPWLFKPQWAAVYGPLLMTCITLYIFYKTNSFQQERMLAKLEQTYLSHEKDSLYGKVVHYEKYVTTLRDSVDSYKNHWLQLQAFKATYGAPSNARPKNLPYQVIMDSTIIVTDEDIAEFLKKADAGVYINFNPHPLWRIQKT